VSLGQVSQISEGIYAYLQPDGSWYLNHTGFLVSATGVISVDATSTERRTRAYLDAIATVTDKPVRTLVNTHHHGDHTHGNYLVSGATIVGHERCREAILGTPMPPPAGIWTDVDRGHLEPAATARSAARRSSTTCSPTCASSSRPRGWRRRRACHRWRPPGPPT